jgi:hypothetical protein
MRTRRSWRNQDRLWRALGGESEPMRPVVTVPRCWDCVSYPQNGRVRGGCTLRGVIMRGQTKNKPCFTGRHRTGR